MPADEKISESGLEPAKEIKYFLGLLAQKDRLIATLEANIERLLMEKRHLQYQLHLATNPVEK